MARSAKRTEGSLWRLTARKVRVFCRRISRREVMTFLLFVAIAAFFWIVQTAYEESDSTYDIEFVVEGQPEGVVFTTHVPSVLRVSLRDNNVHIFGYHYKNQLARLTVDFGRYADAVGNFRVSAAELQSLLISDLLPTTQITAISPAFIDARYSVVGGRRLPVRAVVDCRPAPDYRCQPLVLSTDSVTVNAPAVILDTMTGISTQAYTFVDLTDTLRADLQFALPLGVKATPASVSLTVPVARYVERTFERVPIDVRDVPDGLRLNIFPATVRLACLVDFNVYNDIVPSDFHLSVSWRDVAAAHTDRLPIRINYDDKNHRVERVRIQPDSVEYVLEQLYGSHVGN